MEIYAGLKARLFQNQTKDDMAILNGDDPWVMKLAQDMPGQKRLFGRDPGFDFWSDGEALFCRLNGQVEALLPVADLPLIGRHNELNALAAAAAASALGAPLNPIRAALRTAHSVEHRIEFVRTLDGISYFNDSKSTNMVATMTALDAFTGPVILLFGGRPKKESFAPLAGRFARGVKQIVAFGEATAKIRAEIAPGFPLSEAADMTEALAIARSRAVAGDTILLSPGCTSFDQFNNYEERGRFFKSLVNAL
jgi:UDP-N-acetylmuramoylalanine--D-glutamate ligase